MRKVFRVEKSLLNWSTSETLSSASAERHMWAQLPDRVILSLKCPFLGLAMKVNRAILLWCMVEMSEHKHAESKKVRQGHGWSEQESDVYRQLFMVKSETH